MPKITVGSENGSPVELHYEVQGRGKPVLLIHGWPLNSRSWEKQIEPLVESGHQAITYDRRGFGRSTPSWDGHDYDTIAADLDALLTHLDLAGVTLVGFSAGGGAVARYIGTHGTGRVARAVLASSVTPFLHVTEGNPEGGLDDATIAHFEAGIRADRAAFVDTFLTLLYSAGANRPSARPSVSSAATWPTLLTRVPRSRDPRSSAARTSATTWPASTFRRSSSTGTPTPWCPSTSVVAARRPRSPGARSSSSREARTASTSRTPTSSTRPCSPSSPADPLSGPQAAGPTNRRDRATKGEHDDHP